MYLTQQDMQELHTAGMQVPAIAAAISVGADATLANWLNETLPEYWVWRTDINLTECNEVMDWDEVKLMSDGADRVWRFITSGVNPYLPTLNPANLGIRAGIEAAFSACPNTLSALIARFKRHPTRAEWILASGDGTEASPAYMRYPSDGSLIDTGLASTIRAL